MATLKAGTYIFKAVPTVANPTVDQLLSYKTYTLSADNVYNTNPDSWTTMSSGITSNDTKKTSIVAMTNSEGGTDFSEKSYEAERGWSQWLFADGNIENRYTATDTTKLRTIILETDQTVDDAFYTWFNANIEKPRLSVDLTTLSGWANLSAGSHNIQIVAKASGYRDSEKSQAVSVTKAASETWVLNDEINEYSGATTGEFGRGLNYLSTEFETNGYNVKSLIIDSRGNYTSTGGWGIGLQSNAIPSSASSTIYIYENGGGWTNAAFKNWFFSTAPTGDLLTWLQANGKRAYSVTITKATLLGGTATIRDGNSGSATVIATLSADTDAGITVYPTSGNLYLGYSNSHGEPGYSWYSANWEKPTGDINIDKSYLATVSGDGTIEISASYYTCLTGDTLISLADGSQKRIDEIQLTDKVLAYNPETLTLESDEIVECDSNECKWHTEYDIWTFSDGTAVKTVHRHRFYNVERQAMVYMDEWNIGEHTIRQDGSKVTLISHKNVKERVRHYTIFTKHQNYFANGLLSGNRHTKKMDIR